MPVRIFSHAAICLSAAGSATAVVAKARDSVRARPVRDFVMRRDEFNCRTRRSARRVVGDRRRSWPQPPHRGPMRRVVWFAVMYYPGRAEFADAATRGNLIPVYRELLADGDTPVSAYAALGADDHSFLLESVVGGETWAAYSFVGVAPRAVLTWHAGTAKVEWLEGAGDGRGVAAAEIDGSATRRVVEWQVADPTAALAEVMAEWKPVP